MKSKWLIAYAILFVSSCANKKQDGPEDAFYEAVIEKSTQFYRDGKKEYQQHYVDSVYALQKNISPYGQLLRLIDKAAYNDGEGRHDSSLYYAESSLKLVAEEKIEEQHPKEYITALLFKANSLLSLHRYQDAYDSYYEIKKIAEKGKIDPCVVSDYSYSMAMILYKQKKYQEAAFYFKDSYLKAESFCDAMGYHKIQERIANTALCYTQIGELDSALHYYHEAMAFVNTFIEPQEKDKAVSYAQVCLGVIYGNMAGVFLKQNKLDSVESLLKKSIAINIQPGYENRDAQITQAKLAGLYLQQEKPENAMPVLLQLKKSLDTLSNAEATLAFNMHMGNYFNQIEQPAKANPYITREMRLRDSLESNMARLRLIDVSKELNEREQRFQINVLQKDKRINQLMLWLTIGFSLLVLIIIFQIQANYRRSKKSEHLLRTLNQEVNEQKSQLELTAIQLKKSNKDKDRILKVVAHDLRNPVGSIGAAAEHLYSKYENNEQTQNEMVKLIQNASAHSLSLINELLEMNKDMPGENTVPVLTNVQALIEESVLLMRHKAGEKQQHLKLELETALPDMVLNAHKIKRVLQNLIGNAIKFSYEKSTVTIRAEQNNNGLLIIVKDEGMGIPAEAREHLFDISNLTRRTGTAGEKSHGLGLAVCRQIVEDNGGKLWVETEEGKGAVFFVQLPFA